MSSVHPRKARAVVRLLSACAASAATLFLAQRAPAATQVWDGGGDGSGDAWLADSNWNPDLGTGTGPAPADTAQFDLAGTASTIGIDFGAATNNGAANEAIAQILLNAGISRTITNSSATTPGTIRISGGAGGVGLLNSSSASTLTIQDGVSQPMTITLANGIGIEATNSDATIIVNSVIGEAASSGISKLGLGTVVLNANNTFTGDLSINGGIVSVPFIASAGVAQPIGRGTGQLGLGNAVNNGTLLYTGVGASTNRNILLGSQGGTVSNANPLTFTGVISSNGSFTKAGVGVLTVSANSYTGATIINGGTLSVAADNRLGAVPTTAVTNNIQLNAGALNASTSFTLSTNRGVLLGSSSSTFDVNTGAVVTFNGTISGTGTLNKTGAGVVDLRLGFNTYTGGTVIKNGRIDIEQDRCLGAVPTAPQAANVTLDGGTLRFYSSVAGGITLDNNRGITLTANGGTIDWSQSSNTPTVGYQITSPAGSTLTKLGARTVLFNVAQPNLNGDVNINGGRWNAQVNGAIGNGTVRLQAQPGDFAQLGIGGTNLGLTITVSNPIVLNPTGNGLNAFEVNNSTPTQNELRLTGNITGTGGLVKGNVASTSGILTLSGNNTYTGTTQVKIGTLRVQGGNAIPDSSSVQLDSFTVNGVPVALDLAGSSETIGGLTGGGATDGSVTLGGGTLTVIQSAPSTYAGTISGVGGSFVKDGTDTLTLSNSNNSYSGATTLKAGTLSVPGSPQLGSSTNTLIFNGGTLLPTGAINAPSRNVTLNAGGGTINSNGNAVTLGDIDGAGNLTKSGGGTLTANHVRTAGNLAITAGQLQLKANGSAAGTSVVNSISITTAQLDLADNHLIDHTTGAGTWTGSSYNGLTGLIASGRNTGNWNGNGIITSQTQAIGSNFTSLGVARASDVHPNTASETTLWAGQTITGSDTLVMYTYGGDANLDGKLNVDDYIKIDFGIAAGLTGWSNGDFNYDGKVNIDDYTTVIDANIGIQNGIFFTSGGVGAGASGVTAVPEPIAAAILILPTMLLAARRTRRSPRR